MSNASTTASVPKNHGDERIESDRPAKRTKIMDEAEVKKYEEAAKKLATVTDYRDPMRGVARIKAE